MESSEVGSYEAAASAGPPLPSFSPPSSSPTSSVSSCCSPVGPSPAPLLEQDDHPNEHNNNNSNNNNNNNTNKLEQERKEEMQEEHTTIHEKEEKEEEAPPLLIKSNSSRQQSTTTTTANAAEEKEKEVYTLYVRRLILVDTAEDSAQWASRARRQWGGGRPVFLTVSSNTIPCGSTPPQKIHFDGKSSSQTTTTNHHNNTNNSESQSWSGVSWSHHHHSNNSNHNSSHYEEDNSSGGIVVPLQEESMLMIEASVLRHGKPQTVALSMLDTESMLQENRQYAKYMIHLMPTHAAIDANAVYGVAEVEIHSSLLDDPPDVQFTPLEYNYGTVRVSTTDFYFPPFLLSGGGEYIVSNVLCAMNMTESSSLAMQLVPLRSAEGYLVAEPAQVITVRPQQRVYFSATWALSKRSPMKGMEMQLTVNGSQQPSAPILIHVHSQSPQTGGVLTDLPYQYWVNTTCITNRAMLPSQELPLIRAVLPVFRFLSRNAPVHQREGMIVAFDKDKGEQVLVRANGVPVTMGRYEGQAFDSITAPPSLLPPAGGAALASSPPPSSSSWMSSSAAALKKANLSEVNEALSQLGFDTNASFIVRDPRKLNLFPARGPLLNLSQKTCLCTIVLGTIRGFPMVYETATGVSPSFQVSLTLLDQRGWQVVHGETLPSYHSASGSLRWTEQLVLRKWPGARSTQFVRLNLTEVRPRDGDETPIGAGLLSLPDMTAVYAQNPMSVAFYVYETYSLYDELSSSSLLMKNASVIFSELR